MKEKLERILKAAIKKGFTVFGYVNLKDFQLIIASDWVEVYTTDESIEEQSKVYSLNDLIFSPQSNLIKAIFGETDEWYTTDCTCGGVDFHLFGPDVHKNECAKVKAKRGRAYHLTELAKLNSDEERINYIFDYLETKEGVDG